MRQRKKADMRRGHRFEGEDENAILVEDNVSADKDFKSQRKLFDENQTPGQNEIELSYFARNQ
jgi:hypothetical protein